MKQQRNESLDFLRILCMLMVVCNHLMSWSNLMEQHMIPLTPMWLTSDVLFAFL